MSSPSNPLKEDFANQYTSFARLIGNIRTVEAIAEELDLLSDAVAFSHSYVGMDYSNNKQYLELSCWTSMFDKDSGAIRLGKLVKHLLPKVGKFTKGFDEATRRITMTGEYKGIIIKLSADPPSTCTIEEIEETVDVPEKVIPAHTEKKIRIVMKGDCAPIMDQPKPVTEPEDVSEPVPVLGSQPGEEPF